MAHDDPRLALIYDIDNPDGPDHDFFRQVANASGARHVTDLGCGTGLLTVTLAGPRRQVVGIDPSSTMLAVAQARPGGEAVHWRLGTSEMIEPDSTDLVIMSGNVAMHILGDAWPRTLRDIARGLRPGGRLAFESRNPLAEQWRSWRGATPPRDTPAGRLRESVTTEPPNSDGVVTMHCTNEFLDDGDVVEVVQKLQFRPPAQISSDLETAGLSVLKVAQDWSGSPLTGAPSEPLMVFVAAVLRSTRGSVRSG